MRILLIAALAASMDEKMQAVQLDGADGKPLFSTLEFTKEDEERLASLQREYGQR